MHGGHGHGFSIFIAFLISLFALVHFCTFERAQISTESRSLDRELVSRLKESRLNLSRFIKYKQQHL